MFAESIVGVSSELLFSAIGTLGVYVFYQEKTIVRDKFKEQDKKIEKIEESTKILSREEFEIVKGYVKDSVNAVINSKEFRDDLKQSIKESMLHFESNRSKGEAAMFEHFEGLLQKGLIDIITAVTKKK
jgi:hypothetical protein